MSFTSIGPTWGAEISHKAIAAVIVFFLVLALYITVRFEWKMAIAALVAVLHDILFTRRRVLAVRVPGHARDRDRVPDHPRLLALRHHRRVRQGAGEHAAG